MPAIVSITEFANRTLLISVAPFNSMKEREPTGAGDNPGKS